MDALITEKELASQLKVSIPTLQRWKRLGLPRIKIGGTIRYRMEDILNWAPKAGRTIAPFNIYKSEAMQRKFGFYLRGNFDLSHEQIVRLLNSIASSSEDSADLLVDRLYEKFYQEIQDERR